MMWTAAPWWHWLGMASFWMIIVVVALWATGRIVPVTAAVQTSARSTLDGRLARGEISIEEYRRLRHELAAAGQDQGP